MNLLSFILSLVYGIVAADSASATTANLVTSMAAATMGLLAPWPPQGPIHSPSAVQVDHSLGCAGVLCTGNFFGFCVGCKSKGRDKGNDSHGYDADVPLYMVFLW